MVNEATEAKIEFDRERAEQYDLNIRKAIPGYESLHGMAHSLLKTSLGETANLLIVGSGTGRELIEYAQQNPHWNLTGVDPSGSMMAIAKTELESKGFAEKVKLYTGYLKTLPTTEPMDAATLILVMHFLPDDGAKLELLKSIAQRLQVGAKLILADLHGDRSAPYFNQFIAAWRSYYFSQLDEESKAKAAVKFQASIDNSIHFVTEARIIQLLETAGFSNAHKFYNAFLFGGWIAQYTGI
ncbi:MAG: methyltransferase [Cyanobacteria bacterium J06621_8]